jgi:hypothetical protein
MNTSLFRRELEIRDRHLSALFDALSGDIKAGRLVDPTQLWSNSELISNCGFTDARAAHVIFPDRVNLLTTSAFYDRVYVDLRGYEFATFDDIEDEELFRRVYQMSPVDFLDLVRARRVIPIFHLDLARYTDYLLEKIVFPLLTNELPYMTFAGRSLICQTWQAKYDAFPDPQSQTWGFLMDLVGAMGIGANLVRPEFATDLWNRHATIFDLLGFDEVAKHFVSRDLNFDDFFVAAGISYDSRVPVSDYLRAFDKIDKAKIYALYQKLDKASFFTELQRLNLEIQSASHEVDREEAFLKVVSAPVGLLFYFATVTLGQILGADTVAALKSMVDEDLKTLLRKCRAEFRDAFSRNWERHQLWLNEHHFPEAIELVRLRRLLRQAPRQ